jgi:hypothetical protein
VPDSLLSCKNKISIQRDNSRWSDIASVVYLCRQSLNLLKDVIKPNSDGIDPVSCPLIKTNDAVRITKSISTGRDLSVSYLIYTIGYGMTKDHTGSGCKLHPSTY